MDRDVVALSDDVNDTLHVAKVKIGMDSLSVEVEGEVDDIDVSCAFAVTEETAFDTVGASEDT